MLRVARGIFRFGCHVHDSYCSAHRMSAVLITVHQNSAVLLVAQVVRLQAEAEAVQAGQPPARILKNPIN